MRRQRPVGPDRSRGDWNALCTEAATLAPGHAPGFFCYRFDWVRVGDGQAFATGYYEPEIEGSRTPQPGYVPIYARPARPRPLHQGRRHDGRGPDRRDRRLRPLFHPRRDRGRGAGRQGPRARLGGGPGRPVLPRNPGLGPHSACPTAASCASAMPSQNGREYVAIGRLLRDRGILPPGGASMQAIKDWIRANPDQGRALMRENLSYIFFKELTGPGPLGALNVAGDSARDRRGRSQFVPLGAPVFLDAGPPRGRRPVGRAGHRRRDQGRQPLRYLLGRRRPRRSRSPAACRPTGEALILLPKGVGGPCARSALTKPSCGPGSRPPSGRCRASSVERCQHVAEPKPKAAAPCAASHKAPPPSRRRVRHAARSSDKTLDGSWDRRLRAASVEPDRIARPPRA